MFKLTIIGLGPGAMSYLTLDALLKLESAKCVYLRTGEHPLVDDLAKKDIVFSSFDYLYEESETFDDVYQSIVTILVDRLQREDVVYAVPGNPFVAEKTVQLLFEQYDSKYIDVVHGASFLDAIITKLQLDPVDGLRVVNCLNLSEANSNNQDILVCIQCYNSVVASELKIWLSNLYTDDHPIVITRAVGVPHLELVEEMPLYALDHFKGFDHMTSVIVKPNKSTSRSNLDTLIKIMEKLRSDNGCPWDLEQNHQSLMPYVLEEAYEVAEAIEQHDIFGLEEELGDLLLQVVFHAQIASENGDFNIVDVIEGICNKMVSRHPHVFGDISVDNAQEVLENWDAIKQVENNHKRTSDSLKKLTRSLPALFRSYKVISKAAKVGFDWESVEQALKKCAEEYDEFQVALASRSQVQIEEELGDLLFSLVCVARKLNLDAESVLHKATDKFIQRFEIVETHFENKCENMIDMPLKTLVDAWEMAKNIKNSKKISRNT